MKKLKVESQAIANVTIPVSFKDSVNVGKWVSKNNVNKAIIKLEKVLTHELALPMRTFNTNIPHKRGLGFGGRYPKNVCKYVIKTLNLLKANAKAKGLDTSKLILNQFIANYAVSKNKRARYKTGRSTHLMVGAVVKND